MASPAQDQYLSLFQSMDNHLRVSQETLSDLLDSQDEARRDSARSSSMSFASGLGNAASGIGQGVGAGIKGVGEGIGDAVKGFGSSLPIAGLLGMAGLAFVDAEKIKDNVLTLLSIGDGYQNNMDFFVDGGTLSLILVGLGTGLQKFAIGGAFNAGLQYFAGEGGVSDWPQIVKSNIETLLSIGQNNIVYDSIKGAAVFAGLNFIGQGLLVFGIGGAANAALEYFAGKGGVADWATSVKNNVETLLTIGGGGVLAAAGDTLKGGALMITMGALGVGLGAFGLGAGVAAAVDYFDKDGWAERIKSNVETLLSIVSLPGVFFDTGAFTGIMIALAGGLAAFALGKGVDGLVNGMTNVFDYFTGEKPFAQRIYDEVKTLLLIPQLPGVAGDTAGFVAVMIGLASGLAAFSVGKGVEGLVNGMGNVFDYFTGDKPFAQRILEEVTTLLSIPNLPGVGVDTTKFIGVMGGLADGLLAFTGAKFMDTLATASAAILEFFGFGGDSAFDQIRGIYQNSKQLNEGARAMDKLAISIGKLGNLKFDGSKLNLKRFAEDLKEAVPIIEAAINGQEAGIIWGQKILGLGSDKVNYDIAAANITKLRQALGFEQKTLQAPSQGAKADALSGSSTVLVAPNNSTSVGGSTTINNYYNYYGSQADALAPSMGGGRR